MHSWHGEDYLQVTCQDWAEAAGHSRLAAVLKKTTSTCPKHQTFIPRKRILSGACLPKNLVYYGEIAASTVLFV